MSTIEQQDQAKEHLIDILTELRDITVEDLIQENRLGAELSFKNGVPYFQRILSIFHMLYDLDLDTVPSATLNNLYQIANETKNQISAILAFKLTDNNPISSRDSLIAWFRDSFERFYNTASPVIAFCIRKGTDFDALQREAKDALTQVLATQKEVAASSDQLINEAQATLSKIRQAAAEVGVAQHATHFALEAASYKTTTHYWMLALIVTSSVTALWGFFSFRLFEAAPTDLQNQSIYIIRAFASRIAVLMTLVFMSMWCAKNYAAHNHNFIVNRHRQNALNTFETFVKAAGDDIQTKNAVLLQATQSIFALQSSGYISKDSDIESPNKIIEIVKDVSKAAK